MIYGLLLSTARKPRCCFCRSSCVSPFSLPALPSIAHMADRELEHMAELENWSWRHWNAMKSISAAEVTYCKSATFPFYNHYCLFYIYIVNVIQRLSLFSFCGDCNFQWLLFAVWTVYLSHPIEWAHAVVICRLHGTRVVILCALLCLTC